MASYLAQRIPFTPHTSIPGILDEGTAIEIPICEAIEVFFYLSAGTGDVHLLKFIKEANAGAGRWYRHQNPITVNFATKPDWHGRWIVDKDTPAYYQLLLPAGVTATEAFIQGIRIG